VLTLASFAPADPARVQAFTRSAFATLRERGCTRLTIDVSANGGGDDAVWLESVLPHLATRPYRTGSTYRKKVLATDEAKGGRQATSCAAKSPRGTSHSPATRCASRDR
jgi:hypothetical protein